MPNGRHAAHRRWLRRKCATAGSRNADGADGVALCADILEICRALVPRRSLGVGDANTAATRQYLLAPRVHESRLVAVALEAARSDSRRVGDAGAESFVICSRFVGSKMPRYSTGALPDIAFHRSDAARRCPSMSDTEFAR